jgi:hypothetical protein
VATARATASPRSGARAGGDYLCARRVVGRLPLASSIAYAAPSRANLIAWDALFWLRSSVSRLVWIARFAVGASALRSAGRLAPSEKFDPGGVKLRSDSVRFESNLGGARPARQARKPGRID